MNRIRLLQLEDNDDDVELVRLELARAGLAVDATRARSAEDFVAALDRGGYDLILADYYLPGFSAPAALALVRSRGLDVPFIIVSGSVGEREAAMAMKAGAADFFLKTNLTRLGAAVEREVAEGALRRDRRETAERLRVVEERYRLVVDSVRDYAIFMLDAGGRVATWNKSAQRITGWTEAEVVGKPLATFYDDAAAAGGEPEAHLAAAARDGHYLDEGLRVRRDGETFWAESSTSAMRLGGAVVGFSHVMRDVSERKRLVDELRAAVRARDAFLSIASHELKTPLTSLDLRVETLRRLAHRTGGVPPERLVDALDPITRQVRRLVALINNLLDVTRITSGPMPLVRVELDLAAVVRGVTDQLRDDTDGMRAPVRVIADAPVGGRWDRERIEAVVTHLIANALKYGERRPVEVYVRTVGDEAELAVVDHGIGIAPAEQARIFERFERAVPEQHYGGLGLGLWIVRQLVDAHAGRIAVENTPGGGSTFRVTLPRAL